MYVCKSIIDTQPLTSGYIAQTAASFGLDKYYLLIALYAASQKQGFISRFKRAFRCNKRDIIPSIISIISHMSDDGFDSLNSNTFIVRQPLDSDGHVIDIDIFFNGVYLISSCVVGSAPDIDW